MAGVFLKEIEKMNAEVTEYLGRNAEDEDLLDSSAWVAQQSGFREADAVEIVRGRRSGRS